MSKKSEESSTVDIFQLLEETSERKRRKRREDLLKPLDVTEFFANGNISVDKRTCQGVECKLCIDVCPTNALFWKAGEIGITPELCIYCGACVLSCIVDDCIEIVRTRASGEVERFSKPAEFTILQNCINTKKRLQRVRDFLPKPEDYLERYGQTT